MDVLLAPQVLHQSQTISPWLPLAVSLAALVFTIASFWWNNLRRGSLNVGYPRTFAATTQREAVVLLPLTMSNTGPKALAVRALRLILTQAEQHETLHYVRTRTAMRLNEGAVDFATNFVVEGRQTLLRLAEFQGSTSFSFRAGRVAAKLEVLYEDRDNWTIARMFELSISPAAEEGIPNRFVAYDNGDLLPA